MRPGTQKVSALLAALLASVLLYLGLFRVVDRQLTLGEIGTTWRLKAAYANSLPQPRMAIWAGSNGRYSHRCAAFTATTGLPCVNLSLAVGIGIDFQLRQLETLLRAGDVLYIPLEYSQYHVGRDEMESGAENTVLVHERRDILWTLPPRRIVRALAAFDLTFLIHGLIETGLNARGFKRRNGIEDLTPQGDESGHTAARGAPYQALLRQSTFGKWLMPEQSHAYDVLADFLDRAHARGVRVVAGLPTTPDQVVLDDAGIQRLRAFYARHHAEFIVLPNHSQYPLSCFYDTLYHLNEGCQIAHSTQAGQLLALTLRAPPPP
jgi:hypothetical protein